MTSRQQHGLVVALSILILTIYWPAARYVHGLYVPTSRPQGTVRQLYKLEKYSKRGIAYLETWPGYRSGADLLVYEDGRPLTRAASLEEVNAVPGRFAEEEGVGIALSSSDRSDPTRNQYRYWLVRLVGPR